MVLENTVPIFKFLLYDLPSPCLVLGQEVCDELIDENGVPMPKFGGRGGGQHFLKVLRSKSWLEVPLLEGVPHGSWPSGEARDKPSPKRNRIPLTIRLRTIRERVRMKLYGRTTHIPGPSTKMVIAAGRRFLGPWRLPKGMMWPRQKNSGADSLNWK